ncbi:MAG: addiction module protein [Bacteroidota bacterium]
MTMQSLKTEVSKLTKLEQTELIHYLVELVASESMDLSDELKEELDKRAQALADQTSIGRPAREVLKKYYSE